jgi:hypothetical protein
MEKKTKQPIKNTNALDWWLNEHVELKRIFKKLVKQYRGDLLLGERIRYIVDTHDEVE